mgnify:CR=1 FL=1
MKELIPMNDYGCVYVIETKSGCKIGASKHPQERINTLKDILPLSINRTHIGEMCSNYFENETLLHKHFKSMNVKNEWFDEDFEIIVQKEKELIHSKENVKSSRFCAESLIDKIIGTPESLAREHFEKNNSVLIDAVKKMGFQIVYFDCVPYVQTPDGELSIDLFTSIYMANSASDIWNGTS